MYVIRLMCVNTDHLLQGLQVSTEMETSCQSLSTSITNVVTVETVRETKVTTTLLQSSIVYMLRNVGVNFKLFGSIVEPLIPNSLKCRLGNRVDKSGRSYILASYPCAHGGGKSMPGYKAAQTHTHTNVHK